MASVKAEPISEAVYYPRTINESEVQRVGAITDFFPEQTRAACSHPGASSRFSSTAASTGAIAIFPSNKSISNRVEALEKRTASHTPSPPIPQLPPTVEPMDVAPPSAPTHKRKARPTTIPRRKTGKHRLSLTHAGRAILQQVGISPTRMTPNYADLTPEYRRSLYIAPIPKRMHPEHHAETGRPCASIRKTLQRTSGCHIYGRLLPPLEASDGGSSPRPPPPPPSTSRVLLWAPAHESLSGNAQVHELARDLSCRAECRIHRAASPDTSMPHDSQLTTYTGILQYYRLGRRIYPPAHRDLTRREAVQWRKLQTGSFPQPILYSRIFPEQIAPRCQHCSSPATLIHMVWTCTRYNTDNTNTLESRESLLRVSEPADQRRLIQRAVEAAVSQGIPADLL
ncbi:hypothetical protein HPB50_001505 [Hyalomma asiaticum]|uniref:Uncharacterized protein n=1 Tax=Hyalomma asiaticum TaxID=266040 RepID=A0ACB7T5E2_HYAAI|nr:hypothetical protein HPB50_001505 [Hyalomma asiaticum]